MSAPIVIHFSGNFKVNSMSSIVAVGSNGMSPRPPRMTNASVSPSATSPSTPSVPARPAMPNPCAENRGWYDKQQRGREGQNALSHRRLSIDGDGGKEWTRGQGHTSHSATVVYPVPTGRWKVEAACGSMSADRHPSPRLYPCSLARGRLRVPEDRSCPAQARRSCHRKSRSHR